MWVMVAGTPHSASVKGYPGFVQRRTGDCTYGPLVVRWPVCMCEREV